MNRRLELHDKLIAITPRVYFQPPSNVKLKYPCIIYDRSDITDLFADDEKYRKMTKYSITAIDADPDSDIFEKILELPLSSYDRNYKADNLNHDVINIYY